MSAVVAECLRLAAADDSMGTVMLLLRFNVLMSMVIDAGQLKARLACPVDDARPDLLSNGRHQMLFVIHILESDWN